jgi:hypothetical protein
MLKFVDVNGPCVIEDGVQSRMAEVGMTINNYGDKCVVTTGKGGRAKLEINGSLIDIPPDSYIVVRPQGSRPYKARSESGDLKVWAGRVWSTVFEVFGGRPSGDIVEGGNAVAGVRG